MIYTLTLNPALDKTIEIPNFTLDTVNRVTTLRLDAGGKGINVSKVIKKMGGESVALGILGGNSGKSIKNMLDLEGIKSDFYFTEKETRTNLKIVDKANNTFTDINESGELIENLCIDNYLYNKLSKLQKNDIIVIAGSLPKGADQDTYKTFIIKCKEKGIKVFFDADGDALKNGIQACPYLIKPNIDELSRIFGTPLKSIKEIKSAADSLISKGINFVAVSMGGDGALFVTEKATIFAEAIPVEVKSTVGAGDSMVAALALSEEKGLSITDTARLAVATSAANVMCEGTQAADMKKIEELLLKTVLRKI